MRAYFHRSEVENFIKRDFNYLLKFLNKKGPLSVEKLNKLYIKFNQKCIKQSIKRVAANDRIKNLRDAFELALEICTILNLKDTSSFSESMMNDDFINTIIDYRVSMEQEINAEIERTGVGYKSFLYQQLDTDEKAK